MQREEKKNYVCEEPYD